MCRTVQNDISERSAFQRETGESRGVILPDPQPEIFSALQTPSVTLLQLHTYTHVYVQVHKSNTHFWPGHTHQSTCLREAAKASCELLSRVLNCEQMLLASLAALRLSMASWATLRFHSGLTDGGLTQVILCMIYTHRERENEGLEVTMRRAGEVHCG